MVYAYLSTHSAALFAALSVHLVDGAAIKSGPVTQETIPLPATIANHHQELLRLDAISSLLFPFILGMPWLHAHNPHIDWATGEIKFPSSYCHQHCLQDITCDPPFLLCLDSDFEILQSRWCTILGHF